MGNHGCQSGFYGVKGVCHVRIYIHHQKLLMQKNNTGGGCRFVNPKDPPPNDVAQIMAHTACKRNHPKGPCRHFTP
jgi:hypothetical protein